ncbi:TetR family transcriptional regulator C-terminal domain-containing protein [Rubritalea spongiae]|uniref:TetR family transcriptional regulator C-terminal domain-containing protein n=1 Tax=Rubritalea spongiae TaxID=430797 RepID=A0ABW5DZR7_9BACT
MAAKKSAKKKQAIRKKPTADEIEEYYWDHTLTEGQRPKSVYAFCKQFDLSEGDFHTHFSSFESLEARYWQSTVTDTISVLEADDDYAEYPTHQKLLAFYYTFFSHIQNHRSRITQCFPCLQQMTPSALKAMRSSFTTWADSLIQEGIANGEIADRKKLNDLYAKGLFEQLRFLIDYYRKDNSENFQDTDALIEKSVRFFADSARSGVLDSALDLARFMLRRIQL